MINLYKKIDGKLRFVDYGIPRLSHEYERRGYVVGKTTIVNGKVVGVDAGVPYKDPDKFIIHHIHRARVNTRARANNLICKLIPKRFLNY
jgi:hypothetical protein